MPAGTGGAISAYAFDTMDVVLDVNGYFVTTSGNPSALAFYPLTPCRVVDTRNANGRSGRAVHARRQHARASRCSDGQFLQHRFVSAGVFTEHCRGSAPERSTI